MDKQADNTMPQNAEARIQEILQDQSDHVARQMRKLETYCIVLPFPPSSNTAYPSGKNGLRWLSKQGKAWQAEALPVIEDTLRSMDACESFCMEFWLAFPNNRKCDIDNYIKLPKDAVCVALGIDDNHFVIPDIRIRSLGVDKNDPHCTVIIKPIGAANGNV